ncbi:MAG: class I SAM-dependent methyltransferase [Actinomycetota bacterium]
MPDAIYDDIAEWYEFDFLRVQRAGAEGRIYADLIGADEAVATLLGPGPGRCLEVGCGTGVYASRVRDLGWSPLGVDLSTGMLSFATSRLPVACGDAGRLPIASGSIDAALGVMIHTDVLDLAAVLAEIHRVLRPGGRFVHVGVHPCFIGDFADRANPPDIVVRPGYRHKGRSDPRGPEAGALGRAGQVRNKVGAAHYRLATLLNTVIDAGFEIRRTIEGGDPTPISFSLLAERTR